MKYEFAIQWTYEDGMITIGHSETRDCLEADKAIEAGRYFDECVAIEKVAQKQPKWRDRPSPVVTMELLCRPVPAWSTIKQHQFKEGE